jgi:2-oxoglutarate ferredoxin oxidoreductase subunit alpha
LASAKIILSFSTTPVHAISDDLDILIAFDQETIDVNHHEMREDSII